MPHPHIDKVLGEYKAQEFIELFKRWIPEGRVGRLLKTDLREEAFGDDQILYTWPADAGHLVGVDIKFSTALSAHKRTLAQGKRLECFVADVRALPFCDDTFDIVISTSTLDHFSKADDLAQALRELSRAAKPRSTLILALNNKKNISFFSSIFIGRMLGLVPEPTRFYSINEARKICETTGWGVDAVETAVPIISPSNRFLLALRYVAGSHITESIARKFVIFFRFLSRIVIFKTFAAWFIVLKCSNTKSTNIDKT